MKQTGKRGGTVRCLNCSRVILNGQEKIELGEVSEAGPGAKEESR